MDPTVPTNPAESEPVAEKASHAYALHRMGEALRDLPDFTDVWICIQPGLRDAGDENRATVDAVAQALFGKDGKDETRTGGGYVYGATGTFGPIRVSITAQVPGPPDERDAEIERLRSELAKLHAETDTTGDSFSREPDEVKPTSAVPNGVDGHSEFSGRASVPTLCAAITSGKTCGQPIYWNPPANAWWHQNPGQYGHTATGPSVPPSDGCE